MTTPNFSREGDRPKKVPLQVDLYGIKAVVTPRPDGEPPPKGWREVARRVNLALMRLCSDAPSLMADVVTGLRSVVRGIAELPASLCSRVRRGHDKFDRELESEPTRVKVLVGTAADPMLADPAEELLALKPAYPAEELLALIDEYRAAGIEVVQVRLETGQWAFALVEPEAAEAAIDCAAKAIEGRELDLAPPQTAVFRSKPQIPLEQCDLPSKALNAMNNAGYTTLEQVAVAGVEAVAAVRGIGPAYLESIREALSDRGMGWPE